MYTRLFYMAFACTLLYNSTATATMHTQVVDYKIAGKDFQGFVAFDDAQTGKLPGVIVVHDWLGMSDYVKSRTKQVAALGYVAFAADIYGKDIVAHDHAEAGRLAGAYMNDRHLLRGRMNAAMNYLTHHPRVDAAHVAAMGYCFGGMAALELGRSGASLAGVVTFHGLLNTPTPGDAAHIKAHVLALQGADDPIVPKEQRAAFEDEMRAGHVDWQLMTYGGAMHSFTVPTANAPQSGMLYNANAERRSWEALKDFLAEVLH